LRTQFHVRDAVGRQFARRLPAGARRLNEQAPVLDSGPSDFLPTQGGPTAVLDTAVVQPQEPEGERATLVEGPSVTLEQRRIDASLNRGSERLEFFQAVVEMKALAVGRFHLQPETARVIRDGKEQEVSIAEVQTGNLIRVRPGAQIPVDGEVIEGESAVNESFVTGEPIPKDKSIGDEVIGGSVNQTGTLVVRVTKIGKESFLQQVARHIQEARALKPSIIQLVDRILVYFVPGVLTFAGLAILIWTLGAWLVTGQPDVIRATYAALAVLVMGYPCALGMATPLAMIR